MLQIYFVSNRDPCSLLLVYCGLYESLLRSLLLEGNTIMFKRRKY